MTSVLSLVILVALVCMFPFLLAILAVSGQACCCGHVINSESGLPVCGEVTWHLCSVVRLVLFDQWDTQRWA